MGLRVTPEAFYQDCTLAIGSLGEAVDSIIEGVHPGTAATIPSEYNRLFLLLQYRRECLLLSVFVRKTKAVLSQRFYREVDSNNLITAPSKAGSRKSSLSELLKRKLQNLFGSRSQSIWFAHSNDFLQSIAEIRHSLGQLAAKCAKHFLAASAEDGLLLRQHKLMSLTQVSEIVESMTKEQIQLLPLEREARTGLNYEVNKENFIVVACQERLLVAS